MSYFDSRDELLDLRDEVKEQQAKLDRVRELLDDPYHANTATGQAILFVLEG